jgi:hypothetical protein
MRISRLRAPAAKRSRDRAEGAASHEAVCLAAADRRSYPAAFGVFASAPR